ncbi:hypothetical protein HOG48_01510 [Candidatus Peregrinibacteria bacterium]|nr:hypothetical protein [Candidatus Peregrinibacteria bacterium]
MRNFVLKILLAGIGGILTFSSLAHARVADYDWETVFTGYGTVEIEDDYVRLAPMTATSSWETHAALVVSEEELTGDYEMTFTVENVEQLRENTPPNAWEAPWFVFGYKDVTNIHGDPDQTFTYLILKPDGYGLELGEALEEDDQTFMWTSTYGEDSYDEGVEYDVVLRVENGAITVHIDDVQKFVYNNENDRQTLTLDGKLGFYSEDADVIFSNFDVVDLDGDAADDDDDDDDDDTVDSSDSSVGHFSGGVVRNHPNKEKYVKRSYTPIPLDTKHLDLKNELEAIRLEKERKIKLYSVEKVEKKKENLQEKTIRVRNLLEERRQRYWQKIRERRSEY